ncbi:MAG: hypothetical protein V4622_00910 [Bacteroidota bacterium]
MENLENDSQEDLDHPSKKKASDYYSKPGLNTELILAIIAFSISFFWFVFSIYVINQISFYNFFVFGVGIVLLFIGLYKRNKIKNNDLDF